MYVHHEISLAAYPLLRRRLTRRAFRHRPGVSGIEMSFEYEETLVV